MKTMYAMVAAALFMTMGNAAMASHLRCHNEVVYRERPVDDHHRVIGTAIGAVAGGLIGHQIGGGRGKDLATVGGAVAGGYAGNQIQKHCQERKYRTVERVCTRD